VVLVAGVAALGLANCSAPQVGSKGGIDPKYGVSASPRVVEDGEPVPKGGGRQMVGRPYTVAGKRYVPFEKEKGYSAVGTASWYGSNFHGRLTANGEVFDRGSIAAAHTTMPLPSYARITNLRNKRSIIVRVNDRGPFHGNRIIDLSQRAAEALDFKHLGVAQVKVDYVGRASTRGSDDRMLLATLRTDGSAAPFPGQTGGSVVASAEDSPRAAPAANRSAGATVPELPVREVAEVVTPAVVALAPVAVPTPPPAPQRMTVAAAALSADAMLDLGTIPGAGTPVAGALPVARMGQASVSRSTVAGLFYAPQVAPSARFEQRGPFAGLKPASFARLDRPGN
jgi:rare lipoprotein A